MHQYINDTRYAAKSLLEILAGDSQSYRDLNEAHRSATQKAGTYHSIFMQRQMHPAANYWYTMLAEAEQKREEISKELHKLEGEIMDKRASLAALSSALLQLAKQGISMVRGKPDNCPDGRSIVGVQLKWIIWAGRNQSQHYEFPKHIDDKTKEVFITINSNKCDTMEWDPCGRVNYAYDLIELLDWTSYEQYESDMRSLLG